MIHQPVFAVFADAWLAEISADLREAVAHLRHDTTMRYTNTPLLYFTLRLNSMWKSQGGMAGYRVGHQGHICYNVQRLAQLASRSIEQS